jgi:hypothetical protein
MGRRYVIFSKNLNSLEFSLNFLKNEFLEDLRDQNGMFENIMTNFFEELSHSGNFGKLSR